MHLFIWELTVGWAQCRAKHLCRNKTHRLCIFSRWSWEVRGTFLKYVSFFSVRKRKPTIKDQKINEMITVEPPFPRTLLWWPPSLTPPLLTSTVIAAEVLTDQFQLGQEGERKSRMRGVECCCLCILSALSGQLSAHTSDTTALCIDQSV